MKSKPTYSCDICGRKWPAEQAIYSRHRDVRYCPVEAWHECVRPEDKEAE